MLSRTSRLTHYSLGFKNQSTFSTFVPNHLVTKCHKGVATWLGLTATGVIATVLMGGFTRLTRSGLSMTDWNVSGRRLPNTVEEWEIEFNKYRNTPEFHKIHSDMTVEEFKFIYFNEWFHRQMGRSLGVIFGAGFLYYLARGAFTPLMKKRMLFALGLGGTQGLIGWWMVKSGLKEETLVHKSDPRVSPYRLMTHLSLAAGLFSFLTWNALSIASKPIDPAVLTETTIKSLRKFRLPAYFTLGIAATTFLSGALVAGNDAGRAFNRWPYMTEDGFMPEEYGRDIENKGVKAVFESTPVVQFNHRTLAYSTLLTTGALYTTALKSNLPRPVAVACRMPFYAALIQAALGISTLLMYVPTELGVAHQAGGLMLLGTSVWSAHTIARYLKYIPK